MNTWMRRNLFRTPFDAALTTVGLVIAAAALWRSVRFVFVTGRWDIVRANLSLFLTGSWPQGELWRLVAAIVANGAALGTAAGYLRRRRLTLADDDQRPDLATRLRTTLVRLWPMLVVVLLLLAAARTVGPWLVAGATLAFYRAGSFVGAMLEQRYPGRAGGAVVAGALGVAAGSVWLMASGVGWDNWGGALLNLVLAAVSIALSFPLGVLLALGRRSSLPVVRLLSTAYIELVRGVPLIALLLMANVALGFFIPITLAPGKVVRAVVVFVLFTAAYVAEIVRGGLQSVPVGQFEAGRANGLSPVAITRHIVLPQAIRNVIPALVGQFISLFKDTTLAGAAMGLTDLLAAAQASTSQAEFRGQGLIAETLVFVLAIFWAGSYTMSYESQRLETRLGVGTR